MAAFHFKLFDVDDCGCGMKIGTDGVLLGAWADTRGASQIIDLGAGSGLIALMMAQRVPEARITAIDISPKACDAARENALRSPWAERIDVACADAAAIEIEERPQLIVCNPPFFTSTLKSPDADRAAARHTGSLSPQSALRFAARWLAPGGSIALITPSDIESDLIFEAEMLKLKLRRQCRVASVVGRKPIRTLWQFNTSDGPMSATDIAIRDASNNYTDQYKQLTQDFYLNF